MAQTTFSIRMDSEVKKQFDSFCEDVGMNTTTAFNLFARAVLREKRLMFDITTEPTDLFYSRNNQAELSRRISDIEAGENLSLHELLEA